MPEKASTDIDCHNAIRCSINGDVNEHNVQS